MVGTRQRIALERIDDMPYIMSTKSTSNAHGRHLMRLQEPPCGACRRIVSADRRHCHHSRLRQRDNRLAARRIHHTKHIRRPPEPLRYFVKPRGQCHAQVIHRGRIRTLLVQLPARRARLTPLATITCHQHVRGYSSTMRILSRQRSHSPRWQHLRRIDGVLFSTQHPMRPAHRYKRTITRRHPTGLIIASTTFTTRFLVARLRKRHTRHLVIT
ncbi:hypothetical protein RHDC4_01494 [Rhodocyclaceae bacterium]|nr:hypothetical protein RHDC4_01494 [Rhodocyclaceae bacterium]